MTSTRVPFRTVVPLLGAGLLAAAAWSVLHHRTLPEDVWLSLRHPDPFWTASLPLAVIASFAMTARVLRILTFRAAPHASPGFAEMTALTLTSALGNMVPVQAGLVGRVAYQHRVHGIPVAASVLIAVQSTLLSLAAGAWLGAALLVVRVFGVSWTAAPASIALLACGLADARWRRSALLQSLLIRCLELLLSATRVHACFALIGDPIDPSASLVLGLAANLSNAMPFLGGALGVREWVVGLLAPAVVGVSTPEALAAELLNRAMESIVIVAGGLLSAPMLSRRLSEASRTRVHRPDQSSSEPVWTVRVGPDGTATPQRDSALSPPKTSPPAAS